jgi:hypothetical protein
MERDYSWDDQNPEEMQTWHEFQGQIVEPQNVDSVAFLESNDLELDASFEDDEDWWQKSQWNVTSLDEEILDELKEFLGEEQAIIVCAIKGICYEPRSLQALSAETNLGEDYLLNLLLEAVKKLRETQKYKLWFPNLA